jgi:hypothetical protein
MTARKVTIYILDDELSSAMARAAAFFNFTAASFSAGSPAELAQRLVATADAEGVEIRLIEPSAFLDLPSARLSHGVALVDVNWRNYGGDDPLLRGASIDALENFGLHLAERILALRPPESQFHVLLYSATRGSRVAEAFMEWKLRGVSHVWQAVSGQGTAEMPEIQRYAGLIYESICNDLLAHVAPEVAHDIVEAGEKFRVQPRLLRMQHLVGTRGNDRVDGYCLADLATPYLQRFVRRQGQCKESQLSAAGLEVIEDWIAHFRTSTVAFEFDEPGDNLAVLFLQSILRYWSVDHLDALVLFRRVARSRYFNPAESLRVQLAGGISDPQALSLRYNFARLPQIKLGTELDRQPDKHAGIPVRLRERCVLDVERKVRQGRDAPALLVTTAEKAKRFCFRIEVAAGTIIKNRLWEVREFCRRTDRANVPWDEAARCLALDADNLDLLDILARDPDAALGAVQSLDLGSRHLAECWREAAEALQGAGAALVEFRESVFGLPATVSTSIRRELEKDLVGCEEKLALWRARARRFEEAAKAIGNAPSRERGLHDALALFRAASSFDVRAETYHRHFREIGLAAKRGAFAALRARLRARGDRAALRAHFQQEVARLFPGADDEVHAATLMEVLLSALVAVDDQRLQRFGGDLAAELKRQMTRVLVARLEAEVFVGAHQMPEADESDAVSDRDEAAAVKASAEAAFGDELVARVARWLAPACPAQNVEQLFDALSDMNDTCGNTPGYGLESCFFPAGMPANRRPEMPQPTRSEFLHALAERGVAPDLAVFNRQFATEAAPIA